MEWRRFRIIWTCFNLFKSSNTFIQLHFEQFDFVTGVHSLTRATNGTRNNLSPVSRTIPRTASDSNDQKFRKINGYYEKRSITRSHKRTLHTLLLKAVAVARDANTRRKNYFFILKVTFKLEITFFQFPIFICLSFGNIYTTHFPFPIFPIWISPEALNP